MFMQKNLISPLLLNVFYKKHPNTNSAKNVTGLKLDADLNTQLLNRKLDDKIRTIKMKLQKNEDVTVVFIQNWHMKLFLSSELK